jgi:two-component system nitrogen regulation response regulator GlnG
VLSDDALKLLTAFSFPGNVRQLENLCHWITVMAPGQRIDVADLPAELREPPRPRRAAARRDRLARRARRELAQALARGEQGVGDRLLREFKRTLILRSLAHTGGIGSRRRSGWAGAATRSRGRSTSSGLEPELRKGGGS